MRFSRPCYDKYHRCPGWAGGGTRTARKDLCENGSLPPIYGKLLWRWRLNQCPECRVIVLPYHIRRLDWRWWGWQIGWAGRRLSDAKWDWDNRREDFWYLRFGHSRFRRLYWKIVARRER